MNTTPHEETHGNLYSLHEDAERWTHESAAELIACEGLQPGDVIYEADKVQPKPSSFLSVDNLLEDLDCRAGDECGEWAHDLFIISADLKQELRRHIETWLDENIPVSFYLVDNIRRLEVTEEMVLEAKGGAA